MGVASSTTARVNGADIQTIRSSGKRRRKEKRRMGKRKSEKIRPYTRQRESVAKLKKRPYIWH